jgi:hypothetical protein
MRLKGKLAYKTRRGGCSNDLLVMERDLARTLRGKISPVTTQATGPQEQAKKKM